MPLAAGQTILNGKYKILELIGEGAFVRVWLADDLLAGRWRSRSCGGRTSEGRLRAVSKRIIGKERRG